MPRNVTVTFEDGTKHVYQNAPDNITPDQVEARALKDFSKRVVSLDGGRSAPQGDGSWLGDVGRSFAQGVVGVGKGLVDVFGAETAPSQYLGEVQEKLGRGLTATRQAEIQRRRQLEEEAAKSGNLLNEIGTYLGGVAEAPVQALAQGLGSIIPFVGTGIVGAVAKLGAPAVRAINTVVGAAIGTGSVKGSLYENVEAELRKQGMAPEEAKAKAQEAQSYLGENFLSIVGGGALGAVGARTGAERLLTKEGKEAAAAGMGRRVGKAVLEEAPVEAAQAGQEQLAINLALQRQGIDVDAFRGVAGAAARDAAIGALTAGAVGAVRGPEAQPPTPTPETEAAPEVTPAAPLAPEAQAARETVAKLTGINLDTLAKAAETGTVTLEKAPEGTAVAPASVVEEADVTAAIPTTDEVGRVIPTLRNMGFTDFSKITTPEQQAELVRLTNNYAVETIGKKKNNIKNKISKLLESGRVEPGKQKERADAEPVVGGGPAAGASKRPEVGGEGVGVPVSQPPAGAPAVADVGAGRLAPAEGPAVTPVAGEVEPVGALDENQRRIQFLEEEIPRLQQTLADKEARRAAEKDGRKTKITKNETALRNNLKAFQQELTERKGVETVPEAEQDLTDEEQAALQAELQAEQAGVSATEKKAAAPKKGKKKATTEGALSEEDKAALEAEVSKAQKKAEEADLNEEQRLIKESLQALDTDIPQDVYERHLDFIYTAEGGADILREAGVTEKQIEATRTRVEKLKKKLSGYLSPQRRLIDIAKKIRELDTRIQELTGEYEDQVGYEKAEAAISKEITEAKNERKKLVKKQKDVEKELSGDAKVLLRRAAEGAKGMPMPEVQRIVDRIKAKWKGAPKMEVAFSYDTLPRPIREFLAAEGAKDARGVFYTPTQTVYIIAANNDNEAEIIHTVAHETIGHFGLRKMLGDKYTGMMNLAYMNPAVKALADSYIKDNPNTSKLIATEEALAELVELGKADTSGVKQLFNRLIALTRQFLRFISNNRIASQFSDGEVRNLLSSARQVVERGDVSSASIDDVAPVALLSRRERETKAALQVARTPQEELDELAKGISKKYEDDLTKASLRKRVQNLFTSPEGWTELVRRFQNDRVVAKRLEDTLDKTGLLKSIGEKRNDLYTQLTLAGGRADEAFNQYVYSSMKDLERAVYNYTKASGLDLKDALQKLHFYMIGLHEQERRQVKYIRTVPLDDATKITVKELGITDTPANIRARIYEILKSNENLVDKRQAKFLRDLLDGIVKQYKSETGSSPNGYKSTDINSSDYNVVADMTRGAVDLIRAQLENDPNKELVYAITGRPGEATNTGILKKVHDGTTALNKQANYWTQPVSNFVEFYGYKNYVPFKGRPEPRAGANEEYGREAYDDPNSKMFSGDFVDAAQSFEGRTSISENPLLQSMSDAARASLRVARKDVTLALYNLVTDRDNPTGRPLVKAELGKDGKPMVIPFKDRDLTEFKKYRGNNYIYHYDKDGNIHVLKLADTNLVEAVRRSFRKSQPLTQLLNSGTSLMGQFHTRYNPAFAPMNFVRDALTNAFIMGAEMGGGATYDYLSAIAKRVASGGMYKVAKVAKYYGQKNMAEIERMAAKDPFIADVLEYIQTGGRVTYVQSITAMGQMDELVKDIGRNKLIRTKEQIDQWVDMWTDTFEFASRAAAYSVVKKQLMASNVPEEAAKVRAAAYAKNLANFEQVGELGRAAGALFMFFRPAATGAVRAIEALAPAFQQNVEKLIRRLPENLRTEKIDAAIKAQTAAYNKAISDGDAGAAAEAQKQLDSLAARRQNILQVQAKFRENHVRQRGVARRMAGAIGGAGMALYVMAWMMADDDELGRNKVATDDMSRWTRYLRLPVPENKYGVDFLQVPWGFGFGAFGAAGAQIMGAIMGKTSIGDMLANMLTISLDSFVPIPVSRINPLDNPLAWMFDSVTPSLARPFAEYMMNVDGLGREIYNNRQTRVGNAYTGGDNIPEAYKGVSKALFDATDGEIDITPNTLYFFANNYVDGVSRIAHNLYNMGLVAAGQKDFDLKTDTMLFDSFVGRKSNYDAREFASIEKQVKARIKRLDTYMNVKPEEFADYVDKYPLDPEIKEIYNKVVGGPLNQLRDAANDIRRMDISIREKKEILDEVKLAQNLLKRKLIDTFKAYDIHP